MGSGWLVGAPETWLVPDSAADLVGHGMEV
jgi:hypothetical protein